MKYYEGHHRPTHRYRNMKFFGFVSKFAGSIITEYIKRIKYGLFLPSVSLLSENPTAARIKSIPQVDAAGASSF
jgi:hypothetical protein